MTEPKYIVRKDSDRGEVTYSVAKIVSEGVTVTKALDLGLAKEEAVLRADKYNTNQN